nr:uncharacterized protein LOC113698244 isoform X4 [Coffea arabica]
MEAFSLRPSLILGARERFGSKHPMHLGVNCGGRLGTNVIAVDGEFPSFLPKEVKEIKDPFARTLAQRIQRLPVKVGFSESCIMSSCVKPRFQHDTDPVVLLHCFDSSCLEWRCTYPLLEDAALETWAIDILGWGFSDLGSSSNPYSNFRGEREYNFSLSSDFLPAMRHPKDIIFTRCFGKITSRTPLWRTHIKRPMILVGPSLGAAVAIDFAVNFPEAVEKLILINASVYAEGTGLLTKLPKFLAYAGVSLLKSLPLRLYANLLAFDDIPLSKCFDWANVGRLHCLLPWWEDATVNYMLSGGYNVVNQIKQRLHGELPDASVHQIPDCGHLPHVEKPEIVARLIADFARPGAPKEEQEPIVLNSVDGKNTFLFNVLRVENA